MRARALAWLVAIAACSAPTPLPCADDSTCSPGICADGFCATADLACASGYRYHESAGDLAGACTHESASGGGGSGGSGDPVYALDAMKTIDASSARDDVRPSCASASGRDVVFEATLTSERRLYIDTYGSSYAAVIAVYDGRCASFGSERSCSPGTCGPAFAQWSEILPAGTYCIVIDQADTAPAGTLVVRSTSGPPSPLGRITNYMDAPNIGDTCGPDLLKSCSATSAGEAIWFMTTCSGGTLYADSCIDGDYTGNVALWTFGPAPVACGPGCGAPPADGIVYSLPGPSPLWVVADELSSAGCGTVEVDVAL